MFAAIFQGALAAAVAVGGPDDAPTNKRVDVLGLQICMEEANDGLPCHIRLFRDESTAQQGEVTPMQLTFFGKHICVGRVPDAVACDFRLGEDSDSHVVARGGVR
jgi:hypothetical protein